MKIRFKLGLTATMLSFLGFGAGGAEFDFYERFTSLLETNRFNPDLTNRTISLREFRDSGEIVGVKLGTSMRVAVERWGKPRNIYAFCGGGPVLVFGHGFLNFRGEKVVRVSISPNSIPGLRFEGGLTATNTPAQFAKMLGLPTPSPADWSLISETASGLIELQWTHFAAGGWQLSYLSLEMPGLRGSKLR